MNPNRTRIVRLETCPGCDDSDNARHVHLPDYQVVEDHRDGTQSVRVPERLFNQDGQIDARAIGIRYAKQRKWDRVNLELPAYSQKPPTTELPRPPRPRRPRTEGT